MNRFGIVTLTHDDDLYNAMDAIKRRRYGGHPHAFLYNEPRDRAKHDTDIIYLSGREHPSGVPMMLEKFVFFIDNFLNRPPWDQCSHVVRANASTYLNLPLLERRIAKLPRTGCYAGRIVRRDRFVSGTCIIFSRDTAAALSRIVRDEHLARLEMEDDLVIAQAMQRNGTLPINLPMKHLIGGTLPSDAELKLVLRRFPLVRVRNDPDRLQTDLAIWHGLDRLSD